MLTLIAMLSLISDPATSPVLPKVGTDLIPGPPALPADLPEKIAVTEPVAGTLLPYPRDVAVGKLVGYCVEDYPRVVREAVDRIREVEEITCNGRLAVQRVQYLRQEAAEPRPWSTLQVVGMVAGALAVGALGGLGVGLAR